MSRASCPHGLPASGCQICQVLEPTAVPARGAGRRPALRFGGSALAGVVVLALVGVVAVGWLAAAVFALFRIVELLAVAAIAGWVGWKLGVQQGKRRGKRSP